MKNLLSRWGSKESKTSSSTKVITRDGFRQELTAAVQPFSIAKTSLTPKTKCSLEP